VRGFLAGRFELPRDETVSMVSAMKLIVSGWGVFLGVKNGDDIHKEWRKRERASCRECGDGNSSNQRCFHIFLKIGFSKMFD